jgi:hypothetical protein
LKTRPIIEKDRYEVYFCPEDCGCPVETITVVQEELRYVRCYRANEINKGIVDFFRG